MKRILLSLLKSEAGIFYCITLIAVVLFMLAKLVLQITRHSERSPTLPAQTIPVVKIVPDKNNQLNALVRSYEAESQVQKELIDSLSRALQVKSKQVKAYDRYIIQTDTVLIESIHFRAGADSVRLYKKDAYLQLLAVGKDTGVSYLKLTHRDTLYRTEIRRSPLLRHSYTEVYLRNASPYNKISHGASFHVRTPKPWLTLGPYAGYDPFSRRITFGIAIQCPLVTLYAK